MVDLVALYQAHDIPVLMATAGGLAWCGAEYYARRSTWRQGAARRPPSTIDRGTYPVIASGVGVGLLASTALFLTGGSGYLPLWVGVLGAVVLAVGLSVRVWALTTLGRFFTMPITLRADHELVRSGPYRVVRHPAYTAGLLSMIAIPMLLGTAGGLTVTVIAGLVVYVYRIHIEEAVLRSRFGERYLAYSRGTWRLFPYLY